MLHFILGRSGFGKTEYLRRHFADLAQKGEEKLLFLVPDQISFETETAFLELLGPAVSRRILVLGFSRLSDYVFERTGNRFSQFADDGVRHLVMNLALEQVADSLTVFDKRCGMNDMRELMLSAVKEYKKCALSPDDLLSAADETDDETLRGKLRDTAAVYAAYDAIMEKSYMDPLDSLTKVAELLTDHPLFADYTVALDSFYGFTSQEYEVVERLMRQSRDMLVALTDDNLDGSLFFVPRRTRSRLTRMAQEMGEEIAPNVILNEPMRFANDELRALECNAYRLRKEPFDGECSAIELYRASGIYDECDYAARSIRKLIEEGCRYRDIAVIARSIDAYRGILDTIFDKYGIRYFMDKPQNIDASPLVRLVTAAFEIVNRGFERESVLALLKTGLCSYDVERIADFENYLYIWDVSGRGFFEPFTSPPDGFADEMTKAQEKRLAQIERLRADIIGKLRDFSRAVKDTDGRGIARALMKLLYALNCDKNINKLCDTLETVGETDLAADLVRLWNVLCGILDKTVAVIGDHAISPRRFSELLYTNFASSEIANIPRGLDEVDISTADRSLIADKKVVFLIGAVEGEFPHTPVEAGVFTDDERVRLKEELHLSLSDSIEELMATERYYAYSALTAAEERLFVSWSNADMRGEALSPSDMIGELTASLPNLRLYSFDEVPIEERLRSKRAAFDYLIAHYRGSSPAVAALKSYYHEDGDYRDILTAVDDVLRRRPRRMEQPDLPRQLFGEEMGLSSTRIDVYHKCAFRYFCEYGLRVRERRRAAVDALEYGTLMHYIFEQFFGSYPREQYLAMDSEQVTEIVEELVDSYVETHFGGTENKSKRFLYLLMRIKTASSRLILHMLAELRESDFVPTDFELGVGEDIPAYTMALDDGLSLTVRGSVDRVDTCDADGKRYLRVVDYKTGTKEFSVNDLVYGLNLQMFLYLYAIEKNGSERYGEITPAGVLYMPAVSPNVSADPDSTEEEIRAEVLKKYRMKGVILNDAEVVMHMEHDGKGTFIPVKLKDGTPSASAGSLATIEELGAIFRQIDALIRLMAENLYAGDVAALPLKGESYDGCAYCPYQSVCLREEDDPAREAEKLSPEEVFARFMREGEDNA